MYLTDKCQRKIKRQCTMNDRYMTWRISKVKYVLIFPVLIFFWLPFLIMLHFYRESFYILQSKIWLKMTFIRELAYFFSSRSCATNILYNKHVKMTYILRSNKLNRRWRLLEHVDSGLYVLLFIKINILTFCIGSIWSI